MINKFWNFWNSANFKKACWLVVLAAILYFGSNIVHNWMFQEHMKQAKINQPK